MPASPIGIARTHAWLEFVQTEHSVRRAIRLLTASMDWSVTLASARCRPIPTDRRAPVPISVTPAPAVGSSPLPIRRSARFAVLLTVKGPAARTAIVVRRRGIHISASPVFVDRPQSAQRALRLSIVRLQCSAIQGHARVKRNRTSAALAARMKAASANINAAQGPARSAARPTIPTCLLFRDVDLAAIRFAATDIVPRSRIRTAVVETTAQPAPGVTGQPGPQPVRRSESAHPSA